MLSLLVYLKEHAHGHENAVTSDRIAQALNIAVGSREEDRRREVRRMVQRLRRDMDAPIGSTLRVPMGYFYIATEKDKQIAGWIERKGKSELFTARHVRDSYGQSDQLNLGFS